MYWAIVYLTVTLVAAVFALWAPPALAGSAAFLVACVFGALTGLSLVGAALARLR